MHVQFTLYTAVNDERQIMDKQNYVFYQTSQLADGERLRHNVHENHSTVMKLINRDLKIDDATRSTTWSQYI